MSTDAGTGSGAAAYRGFLFADMRGFTAFAERHGNAAAATAVSRFLEIARTAIARHQGAEMKTEGDAIHAVFASASSAVMCGLDIVDGAAELNAREPDRPLGLGVGVHAGEAVETAEGYIGRAVNIAARLCAAARPGEVLVSSTVKGITQASIQVGFIPRGRRRLKGIADPIVVYAVSRDVDARAPRELPQPAVLGTVAAAVIGSIALAALASWILPGGPAASPSQPAEATAQPLVMGPLSIGTYRSSAFQPAISFRIPDTGWAANRDLPSVLGLVREAAPRGSLYLLRVQEVLTNPCSVGGEGASRPSAADVIGLLGTLEHVKLENEQAATVGGHPGRQVDVTIAEGALAACGGLVGGEVGVFDTGEEVWRASPTERFRLLEIGVDGETVTILMSLDWTQSQSVQELEAVMDLGRQILATLEFQPGP